MSHHDQTEWFPNVCGNREREAEEYLSQETYGTRVVRITDNERRLGTRVDRITENFSKFTRID